MVASKRPVPHTGEASTSGSGVKRRAAADSARTRTSTEPPGSAATRGGASTGRSGAFPPDGAGSFTKARTTAHDDDGVDDEEAGGQAGKADDDADSQENDDRESASGPSSLRPLLVSEAVQLIAACFFTPGEVGRRSRWFCRLADARETELPFEPKWPQLNAWANECFELPTLSATSFWAAFFQNPMWATAKYRGNGAYGRLGHQVARQNFPIGLKIVAMQEKKVYVRVRVRVRVRAARAAGRAAG